MRETFILTQDIANDQLIDTHPKPGTRLRSLVDKKVIDPLLLLNVSLSGTTKRLDHQLLDQPHAVGPTDIGILTSKQHSIFVAGTDDAVADTFGEEVRGNLSTVPPAFDPVLMTLGTNVGVATTPALFAVGDLVRIPSPPLSFLYFAEVSSIVGPNLTFVIPGTSTPALFLAGPTGTYTMERVRRWTMSWVDSIGSAFSLTPASYDIGVMRRVFLADIGEEFGTLKTPVAGEAPEVPGGPVGPSPIEFTATAGETMTQGSLVYIFSNGTVKKAARNVTEKEAKVVGAVTADVVVGFTATVRQINLALVRFLPGLTLAAGDLVFLDTDGSGTNVPPTPPTRHTIIGYVFDTSTYDGVTNLKATVKLVIQEPLIVG
jgi:hypothetical protein